jgi:hypothetical protein
MKRRWVRLIIAYLFAGYLGVFLALLTLGGWNAVVRAWDEPIKLGITIPLFWPAHLFNWLGGGRYADESRIYCVYCFSIGTISFGLLSVFAPKALPQGLCPTCGYDLRATPERCPECGTLATSAGTGERGGATEAQRHRGGKVEKRS